MKVEGTVKIVAGELVIYEGKALQGINLLQRSMNLAYEEEMLRLDAKRAHRELGDPGSSE